MQNVFDSDSENIICPCVAIKEINVTKTYGLICKNHFFIDV